jgi:hypothetical protein
MTNPYGPVPLDPPPTAAELAWWRPRQRRGRLIGISGSVVLWGLIGVASHSWGATLAHPLLSLVAILAGGGVTTLLWQGVFWKFHRNLERTRMTRAIRDRRVRSSLLPPAPTDP